MIIFGADPTLIPNVLCPKNVGVKTLLKEVNYELLHLSCFLQLHLGTLSPAL